MTSLECFAGIDGGSQSHQGGLVDQEGNRRGARAFPHRGAGLVEMIDWLLTTTHAAPHVIGMAIDVPHGPVIETLRERGFTGHSVNPKQLDRFRDRGSPAGAKDDRREAWTRAEALRTDGPACRLLEPAAPDLVERREWSRMADELTRDPKRLVSRACQHLWHDSPQFLNVERDLTRAWARDLWHLAPSPDKARRIRTQTVATLLKRHRIRRIDAKTVLEKRRDPAVSVAPGTTEAAVAHLEGIFSQITVIGQPLAKAYRAIDRLMAVQPP